jgi:hypothetical protein
LGGAPLKNERTGESGEKMPFTPFLHAKKENGAGNPEEMDAPNAL